MDNCSKSIAVKAETLRCAQSDSTEMSCR